MSPVRDHTKTRVSNGVRPKISILVTAGPTRERIDPVRFISNYSTGTFGYAIAREARRRGHRVTLISGPVSLKAPPGVRCIKIESALEMLNAVRKEIGKCSCLIMAAAVSDWRPALQPRRKIKRKDGVHNLALVENPDILKEIGRRKGVLTVGFALETEALGLNAVKKLKEKGLDIIVANRLTGGKGLFGDQEIDVIMIDRFGNKSFFREKTKKGLAKIILDKVSNYNI